MENPLADLYFARRDAEDRRMKYLANRIASQTTLTSVELTDRKTLKNKKKLAIALKEIRDFADMLENLEK